MAKTKPADKFLFQPSIK